jgi:acyl-CoA synthetase (AMP-forming)/AMP-acid ligase II
MSACRGVGTLVDALRERAAQDQGHGYRFVTAAGGVADSMSFAEVERRARDVAAEISVVAPPGARAVMLYPPGLEFIVAFFGALYAGVAPVPVLPPGVGDMRGGLRRLEQVVADADPAVVLTTGALLAARDAAGLVVSPAARWLGTDEVGQGRGAGWEPPRVLADDVALVQYTSGSTAEPRGVVVRHRQLLANLEAIRVSMGATADCTAVGWVPSFHDMGLVGFILEALYAGFSSYLLAPQDFLRRPALWLEIISRFGGVIGGGPNFGFELCTRRVTDSELAGVDLSSWRVAFSGAERIRLDVLRRFGARFGPSGFSPRALYPCYGLAEASLFVSGVRRDGGAAGAWVDRQGLEDGQARSAEPGAPEAVEVASCGQPAAGQRVIVVDGDTARPADPGTVGEVWVAGPSIASGYWRRPQESGEVFRATLATGEGPFLRTGDLGFVRDGELYLTGRLKELMIVHGRNIYPTDVEDVAQAVADCLRPGCGASFLADGDSSDLVIVQETSEADVGELRRLALEVRRAVHDRLNVPVADVVFIRPRTVAKTSSGKLRRRACRGDYLAGRLDAAFRLREAPAAGSAVEGA